MTSSTGRQTLADGEQSTPTEDDDDNDQAGDPPASTGIIALEAAETLTRIGWAKSPSAVVTSTGTDFGTDGQAAASSEDWTLAVFDGDDNDDDNDTSTNADSGFDNLAGHDIILNVETFDIGAGCDGRSGRRAHRR